MNIKLNLNSIKSIPANLFLAGNFGLEKENLRVMQTGNLSQKPHPKIFGDKLTHPYIQTDFAENQLELITPICSSPQEAYYFLANLNNIAGQEIGQELLWPQSAPAILPQDEAKIKIAKYSNTQAGKDAKIYREKLAQKYGKKKQLFSGVHYNFSFSEKLLENLFIQSKEKNYLKFKNNLYLKISRNFLKHSWFLVYLTGASPLFHESYACKNYQNNNLAVSQRNGACGYKNKKEYFVSYNSVQDYLANLKKLIKQKKLIDFREFYFPVRLKARDNKNFAASLTKNGIEYLELRVLDLNPLDPNGISLGALELVKIFLLFCLLADSDKYTKKIKEINNFNYLQVALSGRDKNLKLKNNNNQEILFKNYALEIINNLAQIQDILAPKNLKLKNIIQKSKAQILNPEKTLAARIAKKDFLKFNLAQAEINKNLNNAKNYALIGQENLELSTQILIKAAIKKGLEVKILDAQDNFISLSNGKKTEYIKQATKTSLDNYSAIMIMENKIISKYVLAKNNLAVPIGENYFEKNLAQKDFLKFKNQKIVIKPRSTNFGLGITIFKNKFSEKKYKEAINFAFKHDSAILIEEFFPGKEYRFFVLGNKVPAILHRVPANVAGDGKKNIRELVNIKNKNPLRGTGYKTPLEKIKLGQAEKLFLALQGKNFNYIPAKNEIIYLRENSNISTGGDSVDFTDSIPAIYKKIAIRAAKAAGAKICGVDLMIKNIKEKNPQNNYSIIEINFNPAIHIHCFPCEGKNRKLGEEILKFLFG